MIPCTQVPPGGFWRWRRAHATSTLHIMAFALQVRSLASAQTRRESSAKQEAGCVNGIPERNANWLLFSTTNELDNLDSRGGEEAARWRVSLVPRMGCETRRDSVSQFSLSLSCVIQFDNVIELTAPVTSPRAPFYGSWKNGASMMGNLVNYNVG